MFPSGETSVKRMFAFMDGMNEVFVRMAVSGIKTPVADHFEMLVGNVTDKPFNEIHSGDSFFDIGIIFMTVVMKGDEVTVVVVNSGGSNNRSAKIASDISDNRSGIALSGFGIDIETVFVVGITKSFDAFERIIEKRSHFIKKSSAKSISEEVVIEICDIPPEAVITESTFRNETMDMRIPFEITAESMQDHNETRSKVTVFTEFFKHTGDNTGDSMEKTVKKRMIIKEEIS